jgi:flagella basal body P-ring formation protein FlgA
MKRVVTIALTALIFLVVSPPTMAADSAKPHLRDAITVASDIVTLGDLFSNAGDLAAVAVFRAPDLGKSGTVSVDIVADAAVAAGLADFDRDGIDMVSVTRAGRQVAGTEIADALKSALAGSLSTDASHIDIDFDRPPGLLYADPAAATPVTIERVAQSTTGNRFDAIVHIDQGATVQQIRVSGSAVAVQEVITAARQFDRGDIVTAEDLTVTRLPARQANADAASKMEDLIGLAARRSIRAGAPLANRDFEAPNLVERNETVTIIYRGRGLVLTARGKSLNNGARGAGVSVVNLTSGRILTGTVVDRGTVEVTSNAPTGKLALGTLK